MPGVWLLSQLFEPYEPLGCVLASRRSYGQAAAPSCASASSSEMIASTVTADACAHSNSVCALFTIRVACAGLSYSVSGTRSVGVTSSSRLVLQAAISIARQAVASSQPDRRTRPARALCILFIARMGAGWKWRRGISRSGAW